MKRRILIPACVLAAALLAGCNKDENIQGLTDISTTTFQAFTESGGTKTFLENGGSETESHSVLWVPGDAIGIASASDFSRYEYKGDGQTDFAEFEGDPVHGDYFYAVYPYSEKAALSGDMLSLELPSVQEYTPLSFAPGAFPMVARSESTVLEFKNLCGLLKVNLTGTETISSITFRSSGQGVSGPAAVSMDYESVPELVMSDAAGMSVTLDCGEGVALNGTVPVPFYIVLPAGTYDDFSITVTSADGTVMTKENSGLVINRSMVRPTSVVEFVPDEAQGDRAALIAFYNATGGPNWKDNTNWCSDQPLDTWHGVITDSEGRVTEIGLNNNNLSGEAGNTLAPLTALTYLDLYSNNISTLDVSANTALTYLSCGDNSLSELDVSANTALTELTCYFNSLSELDVSRNTALESLICDHNNLSKLDVSANTALKELYCYYNRLSELDVSHNTALTDLYCYNNSLGELDLSNNTALIRLSCFINNLSELDLSNNVALASLYCYGNRMTALDIRNNVNLGKHAGVGCQTDADGNYVDMYLYVTEAQLALWNDTWSGDELNDYVIVSTRMDYFDISPRSFDVPARGGEITVNISTDQDYTIDIVDSDWITLVSGEGVKEGRVVFRVAANTVPSERTGMIQFCAGSNCYNVEVRQEAGTQDVDEELFNKTFYHRSLGMRFTADWCGYCPNMSAAFSTVQEQLPDKFEVVNLHGGGSGLYFSSTGALESQYGISGYPSGIVDGRTEVANYDQSVIVSMVKSTVSETESTYPTVSGISFNSSISGQTLTADVTLYLKKADNYKVTVVVLEDGIVGYQANYYGDTYYDYVHDGVARIAMSNISGDAFTTTEDNVTRTFSYSAEIPADYVKDNLRILVYVQRAYGSQPVVSSGDYGGYYVDNCASAKAGTSLDLVTVEDMDNVGGGNEDFGNDGRHEW